MWMCSRAQKGASARIHEAWSRRFPKESLWSLLLKCERLREQLSIRTNINIFSKSTQLALTIYADAYYNTCYITKAWTRHKVVKWQFQVENYRTGICQQACPLFLKHVCLFNFFCRKHISYLYNIFLVTFLVTVRIMRFKAKKKKKKLTNYKKMK